MNLVKSILVASLLYCFWIVVLDIGAALLVTILPEPGARRLNGNAGFGSLALYYTVWAVAGFFAGFFYIGSGVDSLKENKGMMRDVIIALAVAIVLTYLLIDQLYRMNEMNKYGIYVPGNEYMTLTFLGAFFLAILAGVYFQYREYKDERDLNKAVERETVLGIQSKLTEEEIDAL